MSLELGSFRKVLDSEILTLSKYYNGKIGRYSIHKNLIENLNVCDIEDSVTFFRIKEGNKSNPVNSIINELTTNFKKFNEILYDDTYSFEWFNTPKLLPIDFVDISHLLDPLIIYLNNDNHRKIFRKEVLKIFFRLTEKPYGSLVALTDLIRDFVIPNLNGYDTKRSIEAFLYYLKFRNITLPAPFHFQLSAFERNDDLVDKLIELESTLDKGLKI
ncbi:MAG: hypothetical protein INQ03_24935 [Candidatus Heimdallarchaeota archaeon]|nr:hypothetical protein [Candidatus Heimdallarchaeota archaeon]